MEKDAMMSLLYGGCAVIVTGVLVLALTFIRNRIFKYIGKSASKHKDGAGREDI